MSWTGGPAACRWTPPHYFFGTSTGKRRDPDRFRDRILARAVERANSNRSKQGLPPLPEITPHSLRRTWATFAAMVGRDPKWIAAQIGHVSGERSESSSGHPSPGMRLGVRL